MSASVLIAATSHYFGTFYYELVRGTPVPLAQERARQVLHDVPERHTMRRRRDEEGTPVKLRDWWLPHFYQQRPLVRLKSVLQKSPTLVIADNLEGILPDGEAPLDLTARLQLWNLLLELSKIGVGVLLTSRDTQFGDGRLEPGKYVARLPLHGVFGEDAYVLASCLLNDLGIDRAQVLYSDLRDLLAQLDYHPLAMHLVLPTLRDLSLTQIRSDFTTLLPRFADETETGRNRSLLASLDYSLQRLSEERRELVSRLALFEGGVMESALLAITQAPEDEWIKLRLELERTALLTVEQTHPANGHPFLHLHPVLVPYLRSQLAIDDAVLGKR
jgi:hypothetical protein